MKLEYCAFNCDGQNRCEDYSKYANTLVMKSVSGRGG